MKKRPLVVSAFLLGSVFFGTGFSNQNQDAVVNDKSEKAEVSQNNKTSKARTVITTDGEVDDMNSMIRALLYSNEMDIKGIVLSSSVYHYAGDAEKGIEPFRWTGTEWLTNYLNAYKEAYPNLIKHAKGFPSAEYLRSVTKIGNISSPGEMEKVTDGSEFLKKLFLDKDDSDLYVQTWGGTNTTARALKSIQEEYENTPQWADIKKRVSDKLVIYIILNQDTSYESYIAQNWPGIRIINDRSNFWHFAYAWTSNPSQVNSRLQGAWNYENIQHGHGTLMDLYALMGDGKILAGELPNEQRGSEDYLNSHTQYNRYDFISEGDSPSFLYLVDNGLRSMENPSYGGWGGRFGEVNNNLSQNTVLDFDPYKNRYESEYSLMRWFDDMQDDFAARADWVTASKYKDANHNPTLSIKEGLDLKVKKGEKITLHAKGKDPDGDELMYKWWRYFEADTYEDSKVPPKETTSSFLGLHRELADGEVTDSIPLEGSDTNTVSFTVPKDAKSGDTIHIIAEVQDNGAHGLKHYQRVILTVK
ncbi:DUF1593 domain-containing protein [Neobacillus sp. Marseille-QA0830]